MAAPKLQAHQRDQVIAWLVAGYTGPLIRHWCAERGWPELTDATLSHYRERYREQIEALRRERYATALAEGLALKEERVRRLVAHADELDRIKWQPDKRGRLWNERAWRETLEQIARETGPVGPAPNFTFSFSVEELEAMSDEQLDVLAARARELVSRSQGS